MCFETLLKMGQTRAECPRWQPPPRRNLRSPPSGGQTGTRSRSEMECKGIPADILQRGVKTAAEYNPGREKYSRKQESELNRLLASPVQAGILPPEEQEGGDNDRADGIHQPPRGPDGPVHRPVRESLQGQGRDADRCAYCRADHSCEKSKFENILRPLKGMLAAGKAAYQVAADHPFEGVSNGDAERSCYGTRGGQIHQECPRQDHGPDAIPENQERCERDPGARPYRGCACMHKGEFQTKFPGDEIGSAKGC